MNGFQRRKNWDENYFYSDLDEALKRKGSRRRMESRVVAANTKLLRLGPSDNTMIAVKYHNTNILTYHPDNRVTFRNNGWNTVTTMQRMRTFLDHNMLGSFRGEWYLNVFIPMDTTLMDDATWETYEGRQLMPVKVEFIDGVTVDLNNREIVAHPHAQPIVAIGSRTFEAAHNETRVLWAMRDSLLDMKRRGNLSTESIRFALDRRDAYIKVQEQFADQLKAFEIGTSTALYALEETITQLAKG